MDITVSKLKDQSGMKPPIPFLLCESCMTEASANKTDYTTLPPDHAFYCCGDPMQLYTKETRYEAVNRAQRGGTAMERYQIKCGTCKVQWAETGEYATLAATHDCRVTYLASHPLERSPAASLCTPGNHYSVKAIKGTYRPDVTCDSRCTGAKGASCDCSCGGENHGANQ